MNNNQSSNILDVGCGHNPYKQADVVCDLFKDSNIHRGKHDLKTLNKPFILCDAQYLPFRDKKFQFVNCTHVLEHVANPCLAFHELKRVAFHGYIETPSWLMENIFGGSTPHKWVITKKNGKLYYRKPTRFSFKWIDLSKWGLNDKRIFPSGFAFYILKTFLGKLRLKIIPEEKGPNSFQSLLITSYLF